MTSPFFFQSSAMDKKESEEKRVNSNEIKPQVFQTQFPVVDLQGKILLPPAEPGRGCSVPAYANPRQALRILKRREMKRRLVLSGRLRMGRKEKRKAENEGKNKTDDGTAEQNTAGGAKRLQQLNSDFKIVQNTTKVEVNYNK